MTLAAASFLAATTARPAPAHPRGLRPAGWPLAGDRDTRGAPPAGSESSVSSITLNSLNNDRFAAVKDVQTVVKRASPTGGQGEDMRRGLLIAFKRVVSRAMIVDADAAAPYLLPCNTPEFYNNDEDIDCDVPRAPGTGSSMRRRRT
jgi:hypothetical protein